MKVRIPKEITTSWVKNYFIWNLKQDKFNINNMVHYDKPITQNSVELIRDGFLIVISIRGIDFYPANENGMIRHDTDERPRHFNRILSIDDFDTIIKNARFLDPNIIAKNASEVGVI